MKLSRRSWVLLGTATLLTAGGMKILGERDEDLVLALIRSKLGHIRIDSDDVRRFARDYAAANLGSMTILRKLGAQFPGLVFGNGTRRHLPAELSDRLALFERQLFASFLTSIGYFTPQRPARLSYRRLYDPYAATCQSPFFRAIEPGGSH